MRLDMDKKKSVDALLRMLALDLCDQDDSVIEKIHSTINDCGYGFDFADVVNGYRGVFDADIGRVESKKRRKKVGEA